MYEPRFISLDSFSREGKPKDNIIKILPKRRAQKSFDIFKQKGARANSGNGPRCFREHVAGVIFTLCLSTQTERLAWRPSCYKVNPTSIRGIVEVPYITLIHDSRIEVCAKRLAGIMIELDHGELLKAS